MANWNSSELQTPEAFKTIQKNAQNAINNLDILLKLVKGGADVAKLFLLLTNPAGLIIKLAANEIIKLCNDFKEIGVFYLFINPNDEGYGNQTSREFGLAIKLDENGLYQFAPSIAQTGPPGVTEILEVGVAYQKSLDIADLASNYRDKNGKDKNHSFFVPPMPLFGKVPKWELGGYNPDTWTGHAPVTASIPLANGVFPPEMKPSKVLQIMSEAFDDEGDVSTFKIKMGDKDNARSASKIYTASGATIDKNSFDPDKLQTEELFLKPVSESSQFGTTTLSLTQRQIITDRYQSGKPNFAGSSNIQGVEVLAVVALVGVGDYPNFVESFKALAGDPSSLFGGMPSLTEFFDDISAILEKANAPVGTPMTIMNDTTWGTFTASTKDKESWIVGEKSGAKAKISEVVKIEDYSLKKIKTSPVKLEDGTTTVFTTLVDDNEAGNLKKMELLVFMHGTETFFPDETIFEGIKTPEGAPPDLVPGKIVIKEARGSALDPNIAYDGVNLDDVAKYGKVLGIDTNAPDSIHPDWTSIKIKDVIPLYGDFFDEIIQFAEGLKGFAAGADEFILRIIKLIDDTIAEFEEIVNKIKAFLKLFTDGLPGAGIYWLTIKTFGGNKAIQDALTGSDDAPPETLNFCAGFIMVSVSGVGGLSATKGFESLFSGLGLKFQEVAMIPETTELDSAVLKLQEEYKAAKAAQIELATDVFDTLGLNPPVQFRDATTIKFTGWNGVEPNVGDYVLGTKSGAFGQVIGFGGGTLVLDHIKIGPTIAGTTVDEERIVRVLDVASGDFLEFPYAGQLVGTNGLAFDTALDTALPLVGEGRFTTEVLVNRSSHKPNGKGTTVYEVFQGNEGTFSKVDDVEEFVEEQEFTLPANLPWNTFGQDRTVKQQVFKVIDGSVKEPVLESGFNGKFGSFTDDDTIISFGEESAQTFLADIEGRNAEDDKVTRLKQPPTPDRDNTHDMKITVDGDGAITITGEGGIVESHAVALDAKVNPNNLPESAQERTARERANN